MKKTFTVTVDNQELKLAVVRPNFRVSERAQRVHARAYKEAVEGGAFVRATLKKHLKAQKLWDDEKQQRLEELAENLRKGQLLLETGGPGVKLSEARQTALQMRRDRAELQQLNMDFNEADLQTAEAQAENARFNYLVSACTVYADTGKHYWKDYEDYVSRDEDPVAVPAAVALGEILYKVDENFAKNLPENVFLLKYKFCNEKLHLIDKQGRLINADGKLVNEEGRLINESGDLVDEQGHLLTADGHYKVEFTPFTDDLN